MKLLFIVAYSSGVMVGSLGPLTMPVDECYVKAAHWTMIGIALPVPTTFNCEYRRPPKAVRRADGTSAPEVYYPE